MGPGAVPGPLFGGGWCVWRETMMTLNKLIEILQDHAKGAKGSLEVHMVSADTGAKIELRAVQSVQSTPVGAGSWLKDQDDHVRLVFRTEPR